jgi:hypothetical protein
MIRTLLSVTLVSLALLTFNSSDQSLAQQRKAAEKSIWSGQSGGFTIQWTTGNLVARRATSPARIVFSAKSLAEREWKNIQDDVVVEDRDYSRTFRLLSVVGSIISYDDAEYCDCGGAHPSMSDDYRAIDLAKPGGVSDKESGRAARLNDLFPESDLLKALLADPLIRKAVQASKKPEPQTLAKLMETILYQEIESGDCGYSAKEDQLSRFAFHHVEGDQVAVRLSLSHAYEICRGQMIEVGILLPIPASLKRSLMLAASGKAGFLLKDQKRIALDRATNFNFAFSKKSSHP